MTKTHNRLSKLALAAVLITPILASCGQRGGLQRPDPLFRDVTPVETAAEAEKREADANPDVRPRTNEFGGEIPEAAPTDPVQTAPLEATVPPPEDPEE